MFHNSKSEDSSPFATNYQGETSILRVLHHSAGQLRSFPRSVSLGVGWHRSSQKLAHVSLLSARLGCILLAMSFRPVRKIAGIGNVFLAAELVDIAEYELEIYEENPEDHEHHGANWTPGAQKIEGTVVGELPLRKDLKLITEEGYAVNFYLRDSFGSVVVVDPILDSSGNRVH